MGRDHSYECEVCGFMRGGLNDLTCACEQPYVALVHGLATLAHNLATASGLCRAFNLGDAARSGWHSLSDEQQWTPGCGWSAP